MPIAASAAANAAFSPATRPIGSFFSVRITAYAPAAMNAARGQE
jgi:hypothetical protein